MKTFFLFAGPNGSGKSTTVARILENTPECLYLNADYCAKSDPEIAAMPEGVEKSIRAQKETERQLKELIKTGVSIAWETVFSHESRFEIMKYAKEHGYYLHLIYITTKDPAIKSSGCKYGQKPEGTMFQKTKSLQDTIGQLVFFRQCCKKQMRLMFMITQVRTAIPAWFFRKHPEEQILLSIL